jgi:predicted ATP-grasp superfamily ATP-dependent carboligase
LRLLIYEHASAGGYADGTVSPSVLAEGFGMLRSAVSGFQAAGHHVTVLLADGLLKFNPPLNVDYAVPVSSFKEAQDKLRKACGGLDAALIIAPESGGVLQSLVQTVEAMGVKSLNCQSKAIAAVSDKVDLYDKLKANGLSVPKTAAFVFSKSSEDLKSAIRGEFCFPVLFKPIKGEGCSGMSVASAESEVDAAVSKVKSQSLDERFLVQEFVEGQAASISVLATANAALPISLNEQLVNLAAPNRNSSYDGGAVPFEHPFCNEALGLAEQVAERFSGLRGYFGVDVILTEAGPVIVDVNPRLTTSFVGLSCCAGLNLSEAILNAVLHEKLPPAMFFQGTACFEKLRMPTPNADDLQGFYVQKEIVSPPFPVAGFHDACALVLCKGNTVEEAAERLEESKKRTLNIIERGK